MFWFQRLAREHTKKPVFLSSLVALPSVTATFAQHEQVMIMTANGKTLEPMHEMIAEFCGVDIMCQRYVLVGCESVPGFEAVERGEKVDTELVQPGIVDLAKRVISEHPGAFSTPLTPPQELPARIMYPYCSLYPCSPQYRSIRTVRVVLYADRYQGNAVECSQTPSKLLMLVDGKQKHSVTSCDKSVACAIIFHLFFET